MIRLFMAITEEKQKAIDELLAKKKAKEESKNRPANEVYPSNVTMLSSPVAGDGSKVQHDAGPVSSDPSKSRNDSPVSYDKSKTRITY